MCVYVCGARHLSKFQTLTGRSRNREIKEEKGTGRSHGASDE